MIVTVTLSLGQGVVLTDTLGLDLGAYTAAGSRRGLGLTGRYMRCYPDLSVANR